MLSALILSSCRTKKTFNGTSTLKCADYDGSTSALKEKKKSKWRLVLYKDGERVLGKKSKKGKSRLFKKKN
jgi:hypothetical protein